MKTDSKGIPYITRTNTENGLNDTVKYTGSLNPKNVITVGAENAKFFAQPYTFITGNKMYYIAEKKQSLSFKQCLFLTCLFQNSFGENQYGYGLGLTGTRVMRGIIILPIVSPDEPDWHYMEQYIINEIEKHRVPELEEPEDSPIDLHSVEWKPFKIANIFRVFSGVRLTEREMAPGRTPFIGATDCNNGITNWTATKNQSTDKNVLGINYNGSVGSVFYHPYVATFSDDVKRLHLKEPISNIYIGLFLKVMLEKQSKVYGYGYKFNFRRILAQKILLPVTDLDQPNWQFMEDYIKSIPNSKLI